MTKTELSIAVPFFNEEKNITEFYRRVKTVLDSLKLSYEVVAVNDGSTDGTLERLLNLAEKDKKLKIISLSRNFGHEAAVTAALDNTSGALVVLMDGDLQDSPEFIPELIAKINEGYDVVYADHSRREDPYAKRFLYRVFYFALDKFVSYKLPLNSGAFSVMRRPVVDVLSSLHEKNRYVAGLRAWVGFRQVGISYMKKSRFAGKPSQTFLKLLQMALDAGFSFSYVPLRLATYLGLGVSVFAFIVILDVLYAKLIAGTAILGWASPLVSTLFLGGVQLLILGIIGEYLGRIYDEVKQRPYYVVSQKVGF